MSHYKRRKSRRHVRCNICTDNRVGNSLQDGYRKPSVVLIKKLHILSEKEQINEKEDKLQ